MSRLFILIAALLIVGCSKKTYAPKESVTHTTDTVIKVEHILERDTVRESERIYIERRDSIAPILDSLGRMIGQDRWHIIHERNESSRELSRLRAALDSLTAVKSEQTLIREPYPVVQVQEVNRLKWWQKILQGVGVICLIAGAAWIIKKSSH